jgi:Putative transposase, YhgA-like
MGDHDSLFKRAFSVPAHAAGEIRSLLPAPITEHLDLARLKLLPASFVDAEMAHRHADLLFAVPIAGRPSYVYFLFEHQSEPDPLMPWRVLTYQQRIWDACLRAEPERRTLPPILTIVVHHGSQGWTAPRRFHAIIDGAEDLPELRPFVPDFELLIDDLSAVDDEGLQRRPLHPFPKITLWLLRDGREIAALLEHLAAWGAELERLVREDPGREDVLVVLRYILRVAGEWPYETLRQRIIELAPALEETMASAEQQLIQKGTQRTLIRQLRARFGPLDAAVETRIAKADADALDRWTERVLVAQRIDDLFDDE